MKKLMLISLLLLLRFNLYAQDRNVLNSLPDSIFSGKQGKAHVQGIAVDQVKGYIYFSFTDRLLKFDLKGNLIGSVTGFLGHLGDLDINPANGKIYGSLEYKNDEIGKGISKSLGVEQQHENGFYIAVFDGDLIVNPGMNAEKEESLLKTIYIKEALADYEAKTQFGKETKPHRFACSGIDGVAFAPAAGSSHSSKKYLYVAYGVYGDTTRSDNDHQVLLQYDVQDWEKYGQKLSQHHLHHSGPDKPLEKYFVKTGSTRYGIQNLAYDPHTGNLFAAVYRGAKSQFPNYDLFVIDLHKKAKSSSASFGSLQLNIKTLPLLEAGPKHAQSGIRGWNFKWGATGLCPLGNGDFYISHNAKDANGLEHSTVYKYRWIGNKENAFVLAVVSQHELR